MSGNRQCIRCGRRIDAHARICPYCNWDQTQPVPAQQPVEAQQAEVYVPPPDHRWRKPAMAVGGIVFVVLLAALGLAERLRDTGPSAAPITSQQAEQQKLLQKEQEAIAKGVAKPGPRADVTLVPDNGPAPTADQPVTSAPNTTTAQGLVSNTDRTDATAVASSQYSQLAQRADAERRNQQALVDPRSITGAAYEPPPGVHRAQPRPAPSIPPMTSNGQSVPPQAPSRPAVAHTNPIPEYQPVPEIRVGHNATVRLDLTVGADGHVKSVKVSQPVDDMGRLIAAVQSWRFKPATENGVPVAAPFSVDLSFHGNE